MSNKMRIGDICNITTGKLDSNHFVLGGAYPFFTCAPTPLTIDTFAFDDDVILVAGNNASGNFHINRYKGKFNAYQRTYVLTAKNGTNLDYVFYALRIELKRLKERSQGSQTKFLTMPILSNIEIVKKDMCDQQKISAVLSSLDSKIELNNRINAELEALAKTLYDYWFVQFDFPNAEGRPYKTSGGKMVWSEELKTEIPEGWCVGVLSDIANIMMGQSPDGESYNEEGRGVIFFQGCTDFGTRCPTVRKFTTAPSRFAKAGDILLSVRAPVGSINIANVECCIGRGLSALSSKDNCTTYLYEVVTGLKQVFDRRNVDGTTFGAINKDDLYSLKIVKPNKDILRKFQLITGPSFEKQNNIELENRKLSELRDWLLPMLMNGQVKVG